MTILIRGTRATLHTWRAALAVLVVTTIGTTATRADVSATPQRTLPPPIGHALVFSPTPADAEFLHTGLFDEPLVPVAATKPQENADLAHAVIAYRDAVRSSGGKDAVEPLLDFMSEHQNSAWKPALQLNLGLIYRHTGHFSKALETWQDGWQGSQSLKGPQGRTIANAIVARLSQLEAYLGRKELLRPLLTSITDRSVGGTAAQLLTDSHTGLYEMTNDPTDSFRCGPLALLRLLRYHNASPSPVALKVLEDQSPSTDHGLSLTMVQEVAERAGMHYQMAYRASGAAVILPAVAHWKAGHYAAIVDRDANDRYVVQDTTFGEDIRVSAKTIDEESSGYFLVPEGTLPEGWRPVSADEGSAIWGRGNTGTNHDTGATGPDYWDSEWGDLYFEMFDWTFGGYYFDNDPAPPADSAGCPGGCTTSTVELEVVGLQLNDTPVGYHPPVGPDVRFRLVYSHRDTQQPSAFSYTNFGPKWTFNWLSYLVDNVDGAASATVYERGGGSEPFTFLGTSSTTSYPGPYSQTILTRSVNGSGVSTSFTLTHPDGSFEMYGLAVGSQFFMTAVGDRAGNTVTLTYDNQMRVTQLTDTIGEVSTLTYGSSISPLVVTQITDPFGRSASFAYNSSGLLTSITDVLGITSSYTYGQGTDPDFINTLTTPYGTTTFTYGDVSTNSNLGSTRFLKTVDPLGRTSYVEFDQGIDAGDSTGGYMKNPALIPVGTLVSTCDQYLNYRNTFVFDANQYQLATVGGGLNYSDAHVVHWLHTVDLSTASRIRESEKQPLENRVWYNYPGQPQVQCGSIAFGVTAGGLVDYGASGRPSAIGRVVDNGSTQATLLTYNANGNITGMTDPFGRTWAYTYDSNGIDRLTVSNSTAGALLESRTYNSQHLPLTITGANGRTQHIAYNPAGEVTRRTDQLGYVTTLNYDGSYHLKSIVGSISSATYSFAYDNVSRLTSVTDPAGSTLHYSYDNADRLLTTTYPNGTTSKLAYTLLDRTSSTDRLGQKTIYKYDGDREFVSSTDPKGNVTKWGYNAAGKVNSITDANGHTTTFTLDAQSRVTTKNFANGKSDSIAYESSESLIAEVTDALSQVTTYTYNTDGSIANVSYSANQATSSVSYAYDTSYPRVTGITDGIGTTNYSYYPVSSGTLGANKLESVTTPIAGGAGSDSVVYTYDALNRLEGMNVDGVAQSTAFDALGRVTSVSNALDTFTYGYSDGTSRVTSTNSTTGPAAALTYYGPTGDELLQQLNYTTHGGGASLSQFGYTYNSDDLLTTQTLSSPTSEAITYAYDTANRLVSALIGAGSPQYGYAYDKASNLTSITPNGVTQSYSYNSVNAISSGTYDANGSPLSLGGKKYKWDGANRIILFTNPSVGAASTFTYDGLGRLVRVVNTQGKNIVSDHSYLWCGNNRCLAHDNTQSGSPVGTQYFGQGEIVGSTPYYYLTDHLGSVTALITNSGSVASQYTYDPYGNPTVVSGAASDIGYAGYFEHPTSGLNFALYRAYDSAHARWLNRDPIGESGGVNLYAYANGNPISNRDPMGLLSGVVTIGGSLVTGLGVEGWGGIYVTLPSPSNGWTPDIGVVGSGGLGAGWNIGASNQYGIVSGGESEIQGITVNVNGGGTTISGTAMFNQNGLVGGMIGPSVDVGASVVLSQTKAAGLNDVGSALGGAIYELVQMWKFLHPPTDCP